MESGIGGYFRVKFPTDWPMPERYNFNWQELIKKENPIQNLKF